MCLITKCPQILSFLWILWNGGVYCSLSCTWDSHITFFGQLTSKCDKSKILSTCALGMSCVTAIITIQSLHEEIQASVLGYKSKSDTSLIPIQQLTIAIHVKEGTLAHPGTGLLELTTWANSAAFSWALTNPASRFTTMSWLSG